jgi:hypothetical protein
MCCNSQLVTTLVHGQQAMLDEIADSQSQLELLQTPHNYIEVGPYGLGTAPAGSHVVVQSVREGRSDVIWHHGISMGSLEAAHMHPDGNISVVPLDQFMGQILARLSSSGGDHYVGKAGIIEYQGDSDAHRTLTCDLVRWAAKDRDAQRIVYSALSSNCEWFAAWARTGRCVAPPSIAALLSAIPVAVFRPTHPKAM